MFIALVGSVMGTSMAAGPVLGLSTQHEADGHAVEDSAERAAAISNLVLRNSDDDGPTHLLNIVIAADEEFIAKAGPEWSEAATDIVRDASELMRQIGVGITITDVRRWASDDEESNISSLLDDSIVQTGSHSDAVLISLTGQRTDKYDGWARQTPPVLLLRVAVPPIQTTASLVAHELGHILGAGHHGEDHDCPKDGCLMDAKGYAHADTWCDHHREDIAGILAHL